MHDAALAETGAGMEHGVGMNLATPAEVHIVQQDHPGMKHAAFRHHAARTDHPVGPHMGVSRQLGVRTDHCRGMHARRGPSSGEEGVEGLGEGEARLGHRGPGQAPGSGQILQLGIGKEQHRGGGGGVQAGGRGVAWLKEAELTDPSPLQGFRSHKVGIGGQVPGTGLIHRGKLAEQTAEAHGKGEAGQRTWAGS